MKKLFTLLVLTTSIAAFAAPPQGQGGGQGPSSGGRGQSGMQGGQGQGGQQWSGSRQWSGQPQGGQQWSGQQRMWSGQGSGQWQGKHDGKWDGKHDGKWDGHRDGGHWWNRWYGYGYRRGYPYYSPYYYDQYQYVQQPYAYQGSYVLNDQALSAIIRDALNNNFSGRFNYITVIVNNGNVLLQGTVPNPADRQAIEQTVRGINGVQLVDNQIIVQ